MDGFQGREKDIIIITTVRAGDSGASGSGSGGGGGGGGIGFLADVRRMNVALTRGRHCVLVVGHAEWLCQNADWCAMVTDAMQEGNVVHTDYVSDSRLPARYVPACAIMLASMMLS